MNYLNFGDSIEIKRYGMPAITVGNTAVFTDTLSGNDVSYKMNMVFVTNPQTNKMDGMAEVCTKSYAVLERMKLIQPRNLVNLGSFRKFNFVPLKVDYDVNYEVKGM